MLATSLSLPLHRHVLRSLYFFQLLYPLEPIHPRIQCPQSSSHHPHRGAAQRKQPHALICRQEPEDWVRIEAVVRIADFNPPPIQEGDGGGCCEGYQRGIGVHGRRRPGRREQDSIEGKEEGGEEMEC
jgi:hypothetical protein